MWLLPRFRDSEFTKCVLIIIINRSLVIISISLLKQSHNTPEVVHQPLLVITKFVSDLFFCSPCYLVSCRTGVNHGLRVNQVFDKEVWDWKLPEWQEKRTWTLHYSLSHIAVKIPFSSAHREILVSLYAYTMYTLQLTF